jgi:hypothetical protein
MIITANQSGEPGKLTEQVAAVDLVGDLNGEDEQGLPWSFLDEASLQGVRPAVRSAKPGEPLTAAS